MVRYMDQVVEKGSPLLLTLMGLTGGAWAGGVVSENGPWADDTVSRTLGTAGRMSGLTVEGTACGWASVPPGTEPLAGARGSGWAWRHPRPPRSRLPLGVGVGIGIDLPTAASIFALFRSAELLRGGGKGMKGVGPVLLSVSPWPCERSPHG